MNETILIELDETFLAKQLMEVKKWFDHVLTIQSSLEKLTQTVIPKIQEPHIREAIEKMGKTNKHHTQCALNLFQAIQSSPNTLSDTVLGNVVVSLEKSLVFMQDVLGGGVGSWKDLHLMLLMNQQAQGAFAVTEQLGLSLGIKEIVTIAFHVVHEKTMHQLLLQEYMLEMAPVSILYKEEV